MEHYTIAKVSSLTGKEMLAAKYIVYGHTQHFHLGLTVPDVMAFYAHVAKDQCTTLSTVPAQQFLSFTRQSGVKMLALEELLDSEKQEVADFLLQAEK